MRDKLLVLIFSAILLALIIVAVVSIRVYFHNDYIVTASGRHNLNFRVFYLENSIFDENPVPRHLDFLMSYTDYIEIDSSFIATFSNEMDVYYSYRAVKRFIIRHMGTADPSRFVFEEVFQLSETSGAAITNQLVFSAEYTVFPKEHIGIYFDFVQDQVRQMESEGVIAQGLRGFSAELWIEFTYTLRAPEFGLNETITHGYRLSLTAEIYTFMTVGTSGFDWHTNIAVQDTVITLPRIVLFVAAFVLSLLGLIYNAKKLKEDPNVYHREVNFIIKKYTHEIVIYDKPVNTSRYEPRIVQEFSELLKLAINLNKHIMCHKGETRTEFAVIVDEFACMYEINYINDKPDEPDNDDFTDSDETVDFLVVETLDFLQKNT